MQFLLYARVTFKATLNGGTDILFDEDHLDCAEVGKKLQADPSRAGQPGNSACATCSVSVYSRTETILPSRTVKMPTLRLRYGVPLRLVACEVHSDATRSPSASALTSSMVTRVPGAISAAAPPRKGSTIASTPRYVPDQAAPQTVPVATASSA